MDYQLTQTGEQTQNLLDKVPTIETNLNAEILRSTNKDEELETAIGNEKTRAEGAEGALETAIGNEKTRAEGAELALAGDIEDNATAIGNEKTRAEGAEGTLQENIEAEALAREQADGTLQGEIDTINGKIPNAASSSNQLADKAFVNSSIATNTADFKGTYNSLEQLEQVTANANDYGFVVSVDSAGNTVYNRYKYVEGTGWMFEYALNNSSFTAAQWAAIQSGITSLLVAKLADLPTVDQLTTQLNQIIASVTAEKTRAEGAEAALSASIAANTTAIGAEKTRAEGAEAVLREDIADNALAIATEKTRAEGAEGTLQTSINNEKTRAEGAELTLQQNINAEATLRDNADDTLQANIDAINAKIPSAASSSNQLADKAFVNSSISTNTAEFKGTYNSLAELQAVTGANANDYGFVIATDAAGNTVYNRYKYVDGTGWVFEYALNNSSFTSEQWAAIQSGITALLVSKLSGLPDIDGLNAMFAAITSLIPSAATSSNKLVDYAQMVAALATKQSTLTFDETPTAGSDNPVESKGILAAINAAIAPLATQADLTTLAGRVTTAEGRITSAEANITSLDGRISTAEDDIEALRALYNALLQSAPQIIQPTDTWPVANPSATVIYRVIDRVNTPPEYYSDYMWNGTAFVLMATYNNAVDTTPQKDSVNLVTSGGVFANIGAFDISEYNKSGSTLATYADLTAALAALPSDFQKGGMSIKFVQSSDNKYVQARCMAQNFTTDVTQWQGVDDVPTANSQNLVKSGGVASELKKLCSIKIEENPIAGYVAANGVYVEDSDYKTSQYVVVVPDISYIIRSSFISKYDRNGNFIERDDNTVGTFQFNSDVRYIRLSSLAYQSWEIVLSIDEVLDNINKTSYTFEKNYHTDVLNIKARTARLICYTSASDSNKIINNSGFVLNSDIILLVKFIAKNTAENVTLNINNTGAVPLIFNGGNTNEWKQGATLIITYDGTNYIGNELMDYTNSIGMSRNLLVTQRALSDFALEEVPTTAYKDEYVGADGRFYADSNFKRTDYIAVTKGRYLLFATGIGLYDKNYARVSPYRVTPLYNEVYTVPEGVAYIVIYHTATGFSNCYLRRLIDSLANEVAENSKLRNNIEEEKKKEFHVSMSNAEQLAEYGITFDNGVYSVPIEFTDKYYLRFKCKFPTDVNLTNETETIVNIPSYAGTANYGGAILNLEKVVASAYASFQQIKYNAKLIAAPCTSGLTNNYGCVHTPSGVPFKAFVGDDIFSLRFIGDVTAQQNQDICYKIDNSGLSVYHRNGSTIGSVLFVDKDYEQFCEDMISATSVGGALYGIIEFKYFHNTLIDTDSIMRIEDIPMVSNYSWGYDAFPCYVQSTEDDWHTIEIAYNGNYDGANKRNLIRVLVDGYPLYWVDDSFPHEKRGYKGVISLGTADIQIDDLYFTSKRYNIDTPKIMLYVAHGIFNGTDEDSNTGDVNLSMSLGRLETLIDLNKKYDFQYVPIETVRDYLVKGVPLPHDKVWSIIHDDYYEFYSTELGTPSFNFRNLYRKNSIKPATSMIMDEATEAIKQQAPKDREDFGFHLHGTLNCSGVSYSSLVNTIMQDFNNYRQVFGDTNIYTYPYGNTNINVVHVMKELGFSICNITHSNNPMIATKRNCEQSLPRSYTVSTGTVTITKEWLENNIKNVIAF